MTSVLATLGGALCAMLGLPAGWVAGAMFSVAAATLLGFESVLPKTIGPPLLVLLGIGLGSAATPETLRILASAPISFTLLGITVLAVTAATYAFLHWRAGWDRPTAFFAAFPGALSVVLAAADETNADIRRVAVGQSMRVVALVALAPAGALLGTTAAAPDTVALPLEDYLVLAVSGVLGAWLAAKARLPAGLLIGPMVASAALFASGVVEGTMAEVVVVPGLIYLGCLTGSRLRPDDRAILPAIVGPAAIALVIGLFISLLGSWAVAELTGVPFLSAVFAFAPGALETVVALAFALDADPTYVAAHHVARFFAIALLVPLFGRAVQMKQDVVEKR